jgi:hypothetical protein
MPCQETDETQEKTRIIVETKTIHRHSCTITMPTLIQVVEKLTGTKINSEKITGFATTTNGPMVEFDNASKNRKLSIALRWEEQE